MLSKQDFDKINNLFPGWCKGNFGNQDIIYFPPPTYEQVVEAAKKIRISEKKVGEFFRQTEKGRLELQKLYEAQQAGSRARRHA